MLPTRPCARSFAVEDLHFRSDGDGRVVEAYAAAFNVSSEVKDQDGHYMEVIAPTSFDRTIQHRGLNFGVLFNHGKTVHGAPWPEASMPIGVPLEVQADERGVFTATRYLNNPMADHVLDAIRNGAVRAQSFTGRFTKSKREYLQGRARGSLPTITRLEVDMREYGPAVFAVYDEAAILGTRSMELFARALLEKTPDRVAEFLQTFEGATTPLVVDSEPLEQHSENRPAAADDPASERSHSARQTSLRDRIALAARTVREKESGYAIAHRSAAEPSSGNP